MRTAKPSETKAIAKKIAGSDPRLPDYLQKQDDAAAGPAPHITEFPELVDVLPDLAVEYRALTAKIKPLEARKRELAEEINALLQAVGAKKIRGDGWLVFYVEGGYSETISAELLLAAGVSMTQIEEATTRKPKAGYIQAREAK